MPTEPTGTHDRRQGFACDENDGFGAGGNRAGPSGTTRIPFAG